jgi:hypothetical protein
VSQLDHLLSVVKKITKGLDSPPRHLSSTHTAPQLAYIPGQGKCNAKDKELAKRCAYSRVGQPTTG